MVFRLPSFCLVLSVFEIPTFMQNLKDNESQVHHL